MISNFRDVQVDTEGHGLRVRFRFEIEELDASDGKPVLGWQVLDPRSGAWLQEGEHRPVDAFATEPVAAVSEITLSPAELPEGESLVVVSILGAKGWRWPRGDRYVRVHCFNDGNRLSDIRVAVSARAQEWLPRLWEVLRGAFTLPALSILRHRNLIRTMAWRDVVGRYRGSFAGIFWSVLNPLLLMVTYFFVFGVVLQARFGGDPSREGFALYFLAGMLPWLPFSEAVGRAPNVLLEHRNFIKKLVFPVETLPVNLVVSALVTQGFALLIFLAGLLMFRGTIPPSAAWLPVLLAPQILLTLGLCWLLSALGIIFRDLAQVMGFVLTLWFFLTPICYPEESLPAEALPVLALNPFFLLVRAFRDVLLQGHAPNWSHYGAICAMAVAAFLLGYSVFHRLRRSFPDLV